MRLPDCEEALARWLDAHAAVVTASAPALRLELHPAASEPLPPSPLGGDAATASLLPAVVFLRCVDVPVAAHGRGYFTAPPPSIHVNSRGVATHADVADVLRHELVHAVDFAHHGLDLASCGGLACSELRAAAAVECAGEAGSPARFRSCVRGKARTSTEMVFPGGLGRGCVDAVYDACAFVAPEDNPGARGSAFALLVAAETRALAAAAAVGPALGSLDAAR